MLLLLLIPASLSAEGMVGYYRYPAIHGDTIVFAAEGDLWRVGNGGGLAMRLTTHPAEESNPAISPDGRIIAFSAAYEGPTEVYTMPTDGGLPRRRTFEGEQARVVGWSPDGAILYATSHFSGLPNRQIARLDPATGERNLVPLAQASEGTYTPDGRTFFFTRFAFQGSHTKRYQGGTAQSLWRFHEGEAEATPLTADFPGTSKEPMVWNGRVYFVSDRDGSMNLWSMDEAGADLRQHTFHQGWDIASPDLDQGRIVYQLGADLWLYDVASGEDRLLTIHLASDFDQMRLAWVKKPMEFLSAADLSPTGDRVVLTARGQVFVVPAKEGRLVEVTRKSGVRYRDARFLADGRNIVALSDESGEVEVWRLSANGVGSPSQLTNDGQALRLEAVPSPNGRWIAHRDKNLQLWVLDIESHAQTRIATATAGNGDFQDLSWSPDSRWLAWSVPVGNTFKRIFLYNVDTCSITALTSDRFNSWSPAWSRDGKWIYFLSDRVLRTIDLDPFGPRQPDPYLTATVAIFGAALQPGARSPFQPVDELHPETGQDSEEPGEKIATREEAKGHRAEGRPSSGHAERARPIQIDVDGLSHRLYQLPVEPGNYSALAASGERLFWLSSQPGFDKETLTLQSIALRHDVEEPSALLDHVAWYRLSSDGKRVLVRRQDDLYVFPAGAEAPKDKDLAKAKLDLAGWTFQVDPREQWQQMFREAWRLERDYFYDLRLHGVDWQSMLAKYQPLSERVTSRDELDDLIAQLVSELSALHTFVDPGDSRMGNDRLEVASLGAVFARDESDGGWRIEHLYRSDPDLPEEAGPLAAFGVDVGEGDVVKSINGIATLSVEDPGTVLRNQAGKQVLLRVRAGHGGRQRDVIVVPVTPVRASDLRYSDWEYARRLQVEERGRGQIGYLHLRHLVADDYTSWARDFYPVFDRAGLIVDVRGNTGGNIESWILAKLMRKAWFWWQPRLGDPFSNMQFAFRGHLAVLVDESTSSDGEAFAEGVKRFGLGKVIGTRTWGGQIWLNGTNQLVDNGIATAAEFGVYGPEGTWLIEGHGVDPDLVVDNLPHATFAGGDAQLDAAVRYLLDEIAAHPVTPPKPPPYPIKAFPQRP